MTASPDPEPRTGEPMIRIVNEPIGIDKVLESVRDPSAGAIDLFIGTTRDHSRNKKVIALEYEAYTPMALQLMLRICDQVGARWSVLKVAIVHRVGRLMIGEA